MPGPDLGRRFSASVVTAGSRHCADAAVVRSSRVDRWERELAREAAWMGGIARDSGVARGNGRRRGDRGLNERGTAVRGGPLTIGFG